MRTLVTGASGHVGSNLVRTLLDQGDQVRVIVHEDRRGVEGLEVEIVEADVTDDSTLKGAFEGVDRVFHLAAIISILDDPKGIMRRANVNGPRNVAQAALKAGVKRMVHFSSIHAYSHLPMDGAVTEQRGPAESDAMAYDRSKAAGEREVLAAVEQGLNALIVNPTAILGPHDYRPSHMGQVLLDLYHGKFPALVDGGFDWVDVRDVVQGALAAAERGKVGERYLLSGKWAPFKDLAQVVGEVTGAKVPSFVSPMWLARVGAPFAQAYNALRGKRPLYTSSSLRALRCHKVVVSDKAKQNLGFAPRPLKDTIVDSFAWFNEHQMLSPPLTARVPASA